MIDTAALRMKMGNDISVERIGGVNDNMSQCHYHDFYEIYYLESGERYHVAGDTISKIGAGEFIIFPPYSLHRSFGDPNVPFRRIVIYFSPSSIPEVLDNQLRSNGVEIISPTGNMVNNFRNLANELQDETLVNDEYTGMMLRAKLYEFLVNIERNDTARHKPEVESRVSKVMKYLNNNYSEPITLDELGKLTNTSIYHLSREFRKCANATIIEYLTRIRILHAERMFQETDKNMTEIAYATGFNNLNHFSRTFKQITGVSPMQMKKRIFSQAAR